jgi:hypothetical protein
MIGVLFSFAAKMMGGMCHENRPAAVAVNRLGYWEHAILSGVI